MPSSQATSFILKHIGHTCGKGTISAKILVPLYKYDTRKLIARPGLVSVRKPFLTVRSNSIHISQRTNHPMEYFEGVDPEIVSWVIIPALIFLARIMDVTLGTLRIVFISKGDKTIAPLLGFVEVLIWLVAITQVMQNLSNFASYLAWAGGFAAGNFLGLRIEQTLALGQVVVRVITVDSGEDLISRLTNRGYRLTALDARGSRGKVNLLFMIVKRKKLKEVINIIRDYNPNAFYSIEDVRSVSDTGVPSEEGERKRTFTKFLPLRKGK